MVLKRKQLLSPPTCWHPFVSETFPFPFGPRCEENRKEIQMLLYMLTVALENIGKLFANFPCYYYSFLTVMLEAPLNNNNISKHVYSWHWYEHFPYIMWLGFWNNLMRYLLLLMTHEEIKQPVAGHPASDSSNTHQESKLKASTLNPYAIQISRKWFEIPWSNTKQKFPPSPKCF